MQTKNKTLIIIALITFVIFTVAAILIYTSPEYVRARDRLSYLHSDPGQFSVKTEEDINQMYGLNINSAYREWKRDVENTENLISSKQTPCLICGGLAILSLGGAIAIYVQNKKQQKIPTQQLLLLHNSLYFGRSAPQVTTRWSARPSPWLLLLRSP